MMADTQGHGTVKYVGGPRHGQEYTGPLYWRLEFVMPQEPIPVTWPPDTETKQLYYRRGWYFLEHDGQYPDPHWWYEFGGPLDEPKQEAR